MLKMDVCLRRSRWIGLVRSGVPMLGRFRCLPAYRTSLAGICVALVLIVSGCNRNGGNDAGNGVSGGSPIPEAAAPPANREAYSRSGVLNIGQPMPKIEVEGWLNGPGPDTEQLKGKVVVIEAWAWWCGPCRNAARETVYDYEKYKDKGVVFIGLTTEGESAKAKSEEFLKTNGVEWPNGYGAESTLQQLGAQYIPNIWVIGRDGKVVWNFDSRGSVANGIELALAQKAD